MTFIARMKRLLMNQIDDFPDYLKIEGLESISSHDLENAGFSRSKFRTDMTNLAWARKTPKKPVVENHECRRRVREFFEEERQTVFCDRSREVMEFEGEMVSTRYLRGSLHDLRQE